MFVEFQNCFVQQWTAVEPGRYLSAIRNLIVHCAIGGFTYIFSLPHQNYCTRWRNVEQTESAKHLLYECAALQNVINFYETKSLMIWT